METGLQIFIVTFKRIKINSFSAKKDEKKPRNPFAHNNKKKKKRACHRENFDDTIDTQNFFFFSPIPR